ncbi:CDKF-1 [Scenedesmus sp. PABB004]|nr:CDKF-1 [Scenedesmus sp. PABB004]
MPLLEEDAFVSAASGRAYRRVRALGHGAFGEVLLAEELGSGRRVAAKQLWLGADGGGGGALPQRVARELHALRALAGEPNVVALLDVARSGPALFLVLELAATDLGAVLAATSGALPPSVVKALLRGLLRGLAAVHARGLVHRDVKPANLLITHAGEVKLADFGLARSTRADGDGGCPPPGAQQRDLAAELGAQLGLGDVQQQQQQQQQEQQQQEQELQAPPPEPPEPPEQRRRAPRLSGGAGACSGGGGGGLTAAQGTRWYRAPELLYGATDYGPPVDVWAAGLVLAEALGLAPLLPGVSDIDQLSRMQQALGSISPADWPGAAALPDWHKISFAPCPGRPLAALLPDAPPDALALLAALVAYDPARRLSAAAALEHPYFTAPPRPAAPAEVAAAVAAALATPAPSMSPVYARRGVC